MTLGLAPASSIWVSVLSIIREAASLAAIADAAIAGLAARPGVIAVALIGFDRAGRPDLWIGDRVAPEAIRAFLAGDRDPHEDLALAHGAAVRAIPIAGTASVAGVLQVVALGDHPSWADLALIGAQISVRLATLGIDTPLNAHAARIELSDRQREIAWLVARGCTNPEIAKMLRCSESTVKQHVSRLLVLFDVTNRTELATVAPRWSPEASPSRTIYTR